MAGTSSTDSAPLNAADPQERLALLRRNLQRVRENIAAAARRSGRPPESVRLIAVTKTVEVDVIRLALDEGLVDLGENRVQNLTRRAGLVHEARRRQEHFGGENPPQPRWHMIGHLQRNKVRPVLQWSRIIHSLDSLRLADELDGEAQRQDLTVEVLLQVNLSGEGSKSGAAVEALDVLIDDVVRRPRLRLRGLMTMAPLTAEERVLRPIFARLRELAEDARTRGLAPEGFCELSMGMSSDYVTAIEEGATMVRLGTVLFEGLGSPQDTG
jgi:pyridoxal phosphate enzyme (YggS family)